MEHVEGSHRGRRLGASVALALAALASLLALGAERANAATCPSFRVLHDDRIGAASLPAGNYTITTSPAAGLSCSTASELFARFLQDWDGNLPNPWWVVAKGAGKASFMRGNALGFSVARQGGGEGGGNNPAVGRLCPDSFTVNARATTGPLSFPRGQYVLYIPAGSGISCNRASVLFTRFLGSPEGRLPSPWQVKTQTATFYKPEHPLRSSFRVEPLAGASAA